MRLLMAPIFILAACQSVQATANKPSLQPDHAIELSEIQELNCPDETYFDSSSLTYAFSNGEETWGNETRENYAEHARDFASDRLCAAGMNSIYSKRENSAEEIYRLTYMPSFHSPISVEFHISSDEIFYFARSWKYHRDQIMLGEKSHYVFFTGFESWEEKSGNLDMRQANDLRSLFDAEFVCETGIHYPGGHDGSTRYFERLKNQQFCILSEWSEPKNTTAKKNEIEILQLVGLENFHSGY